MLTARITFSPCSIPSPVSEFPSGFGGLLLNYGYFRLVITKITFITSIFAYVIQLAAFGIGGIKC